MRTGTILAALLSLSLMPAFSQDAPRFVRIGAILGDALASGEAAALRGLLLSHAAERGGLRIIDEEGRRIVTKDAGMFDSPEASRPSADYLLSASAARDGDGILLTLELTKIATSERMSLAESYGGFKDLLPDTRRLALDLFDRAFGPAPDRVPRTIFESKPKLSAIAGIWKGDKGVSSVSLRQDGRGFALLDSGARMMLKAVVSGSYVVVSQDQPNSPDFYRPDLDPRSAAIVSAAARRWKWVFSLAADGSSLEGFKESVFVKVDEDGAVSVDNDYLREALWTRPSR